MDTSKGRRTRPRHDTPPGQEPDHAAVAGDSEAFGELLRHHQTGLYNLVRRLVTREDEAVEVTQDIFLQAFRSRHRFDPTRPFRPWLYQIAVNVCRNHRRAGARRELPWAPSEAPFEGRSSPGDAMWARGFDDPERENVRRETIAGLERALAQLTQDQRMLLLLRYSEGLTYEELRAIYHRPPSVMKMRVHRALNRLRQLARQTLQ